MREVSIIFDLDGTLLDTLVDLAETGNIVLRRFGFPSHPVDSYRLFVGDGLRNLVNRMVPADCGDDVLSACVKEFENVYQYRWQRNCCLYPGVGDMLTALKERSIPLAVLSNKPHAFTLQFCETFFPEKPFGLIFGQREGFPKKPAPDVALEISRQFRIPAENTFFVGDSGVDIKTAKFAGMSAVGVSWGFRGTQELLENGADYIINKPLELLEHVGITI